MAHINSIGASMFSDLAMTSATATSLLGGSALETKTSTELLALFDGNPTTEFVRINNIREFPSIGTPPNIVNVPVYGSKTSRQVQGQSDSPSFELTINYVPSEWAAGSTLGGKVGDGNQYIFRFSLMNTEPVAYTSNASGLGSVQNSQYFWVGKIEALLVNPQLTDATTATLTISMQSNLMGAYTV